MKGLINYLSECILPERFELFNQIIQNRTRYITVVLEDIYQSHNASAVLRTCDCFGLQDVHIIENRNEYTINPDVALGSYKWLSLIKYNASKSNTFTAIETLRNKDYRIVATSPHKNGVVLNDLDLLKGKIALFFGTEMKGLSDEVLNNADEFVKIPMFGFTESFNISVSAAIIIHSLTDKLRKLNINWKLSEKERDEVMLNWIRNSIQKSELMEKKYYAMKIEND